MKLIQVYDQEGIEVGLVDVSECSCDDKDLNEVLEGAFNIEDIVDREQLLEEYGIFQVYICGSENINIKEKDEDE